MGGIGLDYSLEEVALLLQGFPYLLQYPVGALVGYIELPFHLLGADPALGIGEYPDGMEPQGERGIGLMEDGIRAGSDLEPTFRALVLLPS